MKGLNVDRRHSQTTAAQVKQRPECPASLQDRSEDRRLMGDVRATLHTLDPEADQKRDFEINTSAAHGRPETYSPSRARAKS
jgi:hypothetical protein